MTPCLGDLSSNLETFNQQPSHSTTPEHLRRNFQSWSNTSKMSSLTPTSSFVTVVSTTTPLTTAPTTLTAPLTANPHVAEILSSETPLPDGATLSLADPISLHVVEKNDSSGSPGSMVNGNPLVRWPQYDNCNGLTSFHRTNGTCYSIHAYSRKEQMSFLGAWGFFVAMAGGFGLILVGGVLSLCIVACAS